MNKNRLRLCSEFTNAETLEQKKKRENKEYWERKENIREMARSLDRAIRYVAYQNRPWYKKIFD